MAIYKQPKVKTLPLVLAAALVLMSLSSLAQTGRASAASMTQTLVRLDRLKFSLPTGGLVCAKPVSAAAAVEGKVLVTIPTNSATDYALSATTTNWVANGVAVDINGTTSTPWVGMSATNATTVAGKVVTWASGDLTPGTLYCFTFGTATTPLTNASNNTENVPGSVETQTTAAATIDKGFYSLGLAGAPANDDQVSISAVTVPPIFTFNLSGNTDAFTSNLSLAAITSTGGRNITVTTNAANGYVIWAKDLNATASKGALKSATTNTFIEGFSAVGTAARTMLTTQRDYGLGVSVTTNGSGTTIAHANYTTQAVGNKVGTLDAVNFQPIATATAGTNTDVINVIERATITATTTAASDYADTITFVGSGLF